MSYNKGFSFYIKYIDIFYEELNFTNEGKKNYRSNLGAALSIFVIIASIVLSIMFGQEIYKRERPVVSTSSEFKNTSTIYMEDLQIYFNVGDPYGNNLNNWREYFSLEVAKLNFTEDGTNIFAGILIDHTIVECQKKHFKKAIKEFKISENSVDSILSTKPSCINLKKTSYFQNPYKSKNSTFYNLDFNLCDTKTKDCPKDLMDVSSEVYFQFSFLDTYVNSNDYYQPIKYYFNTISTQVSNKFLKRNFIGFSENSYVTDFGWILESLVKINYYNHMYTKTETNTISSEYPNAILWVTLESPNITSSYLRSYIKLQSLLASIGGLVNGLIIIIRLLFAHYLRYNFTMSLSEHISLEQINLDKFRDNKKLGNSRNSISYAYEKPQIELSPDKKHEINNIEMTKSANDNISNNKIIQNLKTQIEDCNFEPQESPKKFNLDASSSITKIEKIQDHKSSQKIKNHKFNFNLTDYKKLNYFMYLYYKMTCNKLKVIIYDEIIEEINCLLDIFVFSSHLKYDYMVSDLKNY